MGGVGMGLGVIVHGEVVAAPGGRGNGWTFTGQLFSRRTVEVSINNLQFNGDADPLWLLGNCWGHFARGL